MWANLSMSAVPDETFLKIVAEVVPILKTIAMNHFNTQLEPHLEIYIYYYS